MQALTQEHSVPINAASQGLSKAEAEALVKELNGWTMLTKDDEPRLEKVYKFDDFAQALEFTDKIGALADAEDHHPAILTEWGKVTVDWWTHKIKGLHRNDFIMAAKTDDLTRK
jgi:4a-hydroxytetrahydrobiopterin dehydratase